MLHVLMLQWLTNELPLSVPLAVIFKMYSITNYGLDEIPPKDILYEYSPIKSLTGCNTLGVFVTLNTNNEIMVNRR